MKLCFPVKEIADLDSEVYGHFGSAPAFILIDSDTKVVTAINNADQHHAHGMCNPIGALEGHQVDAVVVGGIGGGALMKLNRAGISVYKAMGKTVRENIELITSKQLLQFHTEHVCAGHSGECSH
jgi:predicted Fe-Mo cluster-binding NifX family protein